MPLAFEIEWEGEDQPILVLPYERNFEADRTNHGFRDLRGRPDLAAEIAEATGSPALKALLVALAQPGSRFFSIGCDLRTWPPREPGEGWQAAGYLQLAYADLHAAATDPGRHLMLGRDLRAHLQRAVGGDAWTVRLAVATINPADLGGPDEVWSPVVEFCAGAAEPGAAEAAAERLIAALHGFLAPGADLQ